MNYDDKSLFFNKISYGLMVGFLSPVLFFLLYYLLRFGQYSLSDFIHLMIQTKKLVNVFSLAVLPNLAPFMLFINSHRYSSGRGVLTATILIGILIFIMKLL